MKTGKRARDGQRVWFYYDQNGHKDVTRHLVYVCAHPLTEADVKGSVNACAHDGVWLTYSGDDVTVHGQQTIVLHTGILAGIRTMASMTLPPLSSPGVSDHAESGTLGFSYDDAANRPWLLSSVTYPDQGRTTFLYNSEADKSAYKSQGLPVGLNNAYIPVVTEEVVTPPESAGTALSEQRLWYKYSSDDNQHNYTGYQNGGSMESGKDNLMDRPDNYIYQVTVDNGLTSTTTRYNKYHLPLSVTQKDNQHHSLLAQSAEQYSPWKNTTFSQLPPDYSFPRQAIKTLYALDGQQQDAAITPATVIQQKQYNNNGQMIWQRDAYGRQTFTQYCPSLGGQSLSGDGCRLAADNVTGKSFKRPCQSNTDGQFTVYRICHG